MSKLPQLLPCPVCRRHVRVEDPRCPFCQAAMPPGRDIARDAEPPRARMGRIAVLTAGAALMGSAASCDSASGPPSGSGGQTMTGSGGRAAGGGGGAQAPDAGTDGGGGADASQADAPIAIYAAAVALPRNRA